MLVLVVEDNLDLAELVIEYLQNDGIDCDHSFNGDHALSLIQQQSFDAIVLDINLPGLNGLQICQAMRQFGIATPCIMLTARNNLDDKLSGFEAGADDYLVKPFAMPELVARLHALAKRHQHSRQITIGDLQVFVGRHYARRGNRQITPSADEWQVLLLLAKKSPEVVSRSELEDLLWPNGCPSNDALKMVIYRLRKQLELPGSQPMIHTIRGVGISLRAAE